MPHNARDFKPKNCCKYGGKLYEDNIKMNEDQHRRKNKKLTSMGFEPTPVKTTALT